jgi:hypothetical protein
VRKARLQGVAEDPVAHKTMQQLSMLGTAQRFHFDNWAECRTKREEEEEEAEDGGE